MRINNFEGQHKGPEIGAFLNNAMEELGILEEPGQPEYVLGFTALRRAHAVRLAAKYKIDLGKATAMTEIVPILDAAWSQGRFPSVPLPKQKLAEEVTREVLAQIKGDKALLRKLLAEDGAAETESPTADAADLSPQIGPPPADQPPSASGRGKWLAMGLAELKDAAKAHGIDARLSRDRMIASLVEVTSEVSRGEDDHVPGGG